MVVRWAWIAALAVACAPGETAELDNPFDPRNATLDDDGDGVSNAEELAEGGDPRISDSDGDGIDDGTDPCPAVAGGDCLAVGVCAAARPGCPCAAEYPATYEEGSETLCDGLDNDCDGDTDEGDLGGGAACVAAGAVGACAEGVERCREGAIACVAADPSEESCNGVDDDCDGDTDEDDPGGGGACVAEAAIGACSSGTERCEAGALACVAAEPAAESCNGVDDDCDGDTDEEDPGGGGACEAAGAIGACGGGTERCVEGVIACVPAEPANEETCNGVDDDCDGDTDEDDPGAGAQCDSGQLGECAAGVEHCVAGAIACVPSATPVEESCNGLDDDCDGDADEDDPGGGAACVADGVDGICADGTERCVAGALACVAAEAADVESCNGLDDDCDGDIDEEVPGVARPCVSGEVGECSDGRTACGVDDDEPGVEQDLICAPILSPQEETCNDRDDDCDGDTDEANPGGGEECGLAEGECTPGITTCVAGDLSCEGALGPVDEACNALDDDCDGDTDEGFLRGDEVCGGGEDEDCDGEVDERCNGCPDGAVVPDGWACVPNTPAEGFLMGAPDDEPGTAGELLHVVHITRPFLIQTMEMTRRQWTEITGSAPFAAIPCELPCDVCEDCDPSCLNDCPADIQSCWDAPACDECVRACVECREACPANRAHWVDAIGLANAMSAADGLPGCYSLENTRGDLGVDFWLDSINWPLVGDCIGYRLPTEAEWEWAARAGTETANYAGAFPNGLFLTGENQCDEQPNTRDIAWYCANAGHLVDGEIVYQANIGSLKDPSPWGLYDVHGNVFEWVWDWYNPYGGGPLTDPLGGAAPAENAVKVVRGGGYNTSWTGMRAASRFTAPVSSRFTNVGIRMVRTVEIE